MVKVFMEWYTTGSVRGRECRVPALEKGWDRENLEANSTEEVIQEAFSWLQQFFRNFRKDFICDWTGFVILGKEEMPRMVLSLKEGTTIRAILAAKQSADILCVNPMITRSF